MLQTFAILLTFQSVGELLTYSLHLPVPGPVIGMVLLVIYLLVDKGRVLEVMQGTVRELLRHLTILFVPAGVGVMTQLNRIGQEWLPIVVATVVSTWLSIAAGALVTRALMRRYDAVWGSQIKQTLVRKHPSFNETYHGYATFSKLIEDAVGLGLLKGNRDKKNGNWWITDVSDVAVGDAKDKGKISKRTPAAKE